METTDKYIQVKDLVEINELFSQDELFYFDSLHSVAVDRDCIIKWDITKGMIDSKLKYYKQNFNYTEFKEGQLLKLIHNKDKIPKYVEFNGVNGAWYKDYQKIPDSELKTLVPQIYEEFVNDLEKMIDDFEAYNFRDIVDNLIYKYK